VLAAAPACLAGDGGEVQAASPAATAAASTATAPARLATAMADRTARKPLEVTHRG
jgi:hypothetical protein